MGVTRIWKTITTTISTLDVHPRIPLIFRRPGGGVQLALWSVGSAVLEVFLCMCPAAEAKGQPGLHDFFRWKNHEIWWMLMIRCLNSQDAWYILSKSSYIHHLYSFVYVDLSENRVAKIHCFPLKGQFRDISISGAIYDLAVPFVLMNCIECAS